MNLSEVYLVNRRLEPFTEERLNAARGLIGPLPDGYVEMVTTLGYGTYCDFLVFWRPEEIRKQLRSVREFLKTAFPDSFGFKPEADFEQCVPIAMSLNGDYLVVCPDQPSTIYAIPRDDFSFYQLPSGLEDPLDWVRCDSRFREYTLKPPFRYFESFVGRESMRISADGPLALDDVANCLKTELADEEVREICHENTVLLFPRAIDGRIQLDQSQGDPRLRVGFCVRYDVDAIERVKSVVASLGSLGFGAEARK